MRCILFATFCVLFSLSATAQSQFFKIVKNYYRVDPFAGSFSAFVDAVKTDPELGHIDFTEKSDTGFFSIKGDYKNFNPFSIKSRKVEVLLAEKRLQLKTNQSFYDTIILYQITGFFDNNAQTQNTLKKEFKRINNKLSSTLSNSNQFSLDKISDIKEGLIVNRFMPSSLTAPISVGWYIKKNNEEIALLIVLRMKYANNKAYPAGSISDYFKALN